MMGPNGHIIFFHKLCGGHGNISAARHHPGHNAHSVGENDGAFGGRLPKLAGEDLIVERKHECQSNDICGVCMVYNAVASLCQPFFDLVVHKVGGKLARGAAAVFKSPAYSVFFSAAVDFDDGDVCCRVQNYVAEIFSASRHEEKLTRKVGNRGADFLPFSRKNKVGFYFLNFFRFYAVGKISSVAFVPALLPAVVGHSYKSFKKFRIFDRHYLRSSKTFFS